VQVLTGTGDLRLDLRSILGTALTARDWSADFSKLDVALSTRLADSKIPNAIPQVATTNEPKIAIQKIGTTDQTARDWSLDLAKLDVALSTRALESGGNLASLLTALNTPTSGGGSNISVGTTAVQLSATSVPCRSVSLKSAKANTGKVYVGFTSGITTSSGFELNSQESVTIAVSNLNKIYLIADAASQDVRYIYVV
jgi:hypothetical protein